MPFIRSPISCLHRYSTLNTRAWAFQEAILSARVLHVTFSRFVLECQLFVEAEGSPYITSIETSRAYLTLESLLKPDQRSFAENWDNIVRLYSGRILTFPSDKLIALSGIADFLGNIHKQEYLAGLWKSELPGSLLWRTRSCWSTSRPSYRAPSWSWASLEGAIDPFWHEAMVPTANFKLVTCYVQPTSPNQYGQVKCGYLVVSAHVTRIQYDEASGTLCSPSQMIL